ncbi:MAG: AraC family transcriptional regulator [Anaerolineae bacterium]|nr:AraC family transcriptional regulator [Anaerolineae bacterium]
MEKSYATVSTGLVRVLLKYASSIGIDPEALCDSLGVDTGRLNDVESRLSFSCFNALGSKIALRADDPDFGLHFAEWSRRSLFGGGDVLSAVIANCPTVGDAMQKLARYHGLATDCVRLELRRQGDKAYYTLEPAHIHLALERHYAEAVLGGLVFTLRGLTDNQIRFSEIRFSHPRPPDITEHRRIFCTPLVFEQRRNELVFRRIDLDLTIFFANPALLERLEQFAQEQFVRLYAPDSWADKVTRLIAKMLLRGEKPTIGAISHDQALSTRHLQNKLKQEGVTYRALLDEVRKEIAFGYLEKGDVAICDLAFLLGFSEQSAFNHAFKRWTGSTPTAVQNR